MFVPPGHLLLDSAPNLGPLISCWEINKFENCWYKCARILEVLKLLFHQQFFNLPSPRRDMSGPILGELSNNWWAGGTILVLLVYGTLALILWIYLQIFPRSICGTEISPAVTLKSHLSYLTSHLIDLKSHLIVWFDFSLNRLIWSFDISLAHFEISIVQIAISYLYTLKPHLYTRKVNFYPLTSYL